MFIWFSIGEIHKIKLMINLVMKELSEYNQIIVYNIKSISHHLL